MADSCPWDEMLLDSLCDVTNEQSLTAFDYDRNDSFFKSLSTLEILPTLESILSDRNYLTTPTLSRAGSFGNKNSTHFKPSLFSKCLAAKVKIEKHKLHRLQRVRKKLKMDEPHSWYSVHLLVSLARSIE